MIKSLSDIFIITILSSSSAYSESYETSLPDSEICVTFQCDIGPLINNTML